MVHNVSVVQIRPVNNTKQIVANVDVRIDDMIHKNFKVIRNTDGTYWVSNPQVDLGGQQYIDTLQFLDMELEVQVKGAIKAAYLRSLQSRTPVPEEHQEEIPE